MTTMKAIWLASLITTINVLVASGFAIGAIIRSAIPCPCRIHSNRGVVAIRDVRGGAHNCSGFCSHWGRSTSRRRLRCRSWVPSPSPCKCWMPESVCLSMILGNALGRSLSTSPILRGVSAFQIQADHAANQRRINASYGAAFPSSPQLRR
jgi:hypothetical protein